MLPQHDVEAMQYVHQLLSDEHLPPNVVMTDVVRVKALKDSNSFSNSIKPFVKVRVFASASVYDKQRKPFDEHHTAPHDGADAVFDERLTTGVDDLEHSTVEIEVWDTDN